MQRKLASIQVIEDLIPIKDADRIELAKVLGWSIIVNKGQFKKKDLCVFFEIDSVLPERPEFEFLRSRKFRIKTLRSTKFGVISQGLAMPIDILGEVGGFVVSMNGEKKTIIDMIGVDVTEFLGVQKYEPPMEGGRGTNAKGVFPTYIVQETDEFRIQSFPKLLEEMYGLPYVAYIKYEGTSFTCYHFNDLDGVCSRHQELRESDGDVYWRIAHKYDLPKKLEEYCKLIGKNYAIQGEICGPRIMWGGWNPVGIRQDDLFIFTVYDIDAHLYLGYEAAESVAKDLGLKFVALFEKGDSFNYTIEELEAKTKGVCYPGTTNQVEGLVFSTQKPTYSPTIGRRLSFKVIDKEYLASIK